VDGLAADLGGALRPAAVEKILDGQASPLFVGLDAPEVPYTVNIPNFGGTSLVFCRAHPHEASRVVCRHTSGAPDQDGLEFLGAHHCAHPGPPGGAGMAALDHHGRDPDEVLPGLADGGHLGLGVCFLQQEIGGVIGILPPDPIGRTDLDVVVIDPEVDRGRCGATDHQAVMAGAAELGPPGAAHSGLTPDSGERGPGDEGGAGAARDGGSREEAGDDYQGISRMKGVHGRIAQVHEEPGSQAAAHEILPVQLVRLGSCLHRPGGQIHL
jgi:hypothetical protein